ncbi:hypothetical protein RE628_25475 [Paenibacillus sp. D2_2]|uniref:hypothetical protein n=1 Tax=Paenibacillus sp. D2_2 TaxID=3073092 RepID=UPI002814FE98|nr:hypothetical protein [Paenibacillus sp. D2_2]WMT40502.1 hypothetical protein RE628_25475 [Paenibacillus sp. D2_2]
MATHFHEDAEQLIRKRDFYQNAIRSDLSSVMKEKFTADFHIELKKHKMEEWEDIFYQVSLK